MNNLIRAYSYTDFQSQNHDNTSYISSLRRINGKEAESSKENVIEINVDINKGKAEKDNELQNNFCMECMMDTPMRAKHCRVCLKCVVTFDHHCFWVGNCIGERNKRLFLVFLLLHSMEIGYMMIVVFIFNIVTILL
jgi:hypothetical protein